MASSILFFFVLLSAAALPLSVLSSGGYSIGLIHRDAPNSPFHNSSLSHSDRLLAAARRSIARANWFRASSTKAAAANIVSPLIPDNFEYLATMNLGTPPLKTMLLADTGSDLVWTHCKPCTDCNNQTDPIFDPTTSSTYGTVSCDADSCSALSKRRCGEGSICEYLYSYGGGFYTIGALSSETFTFNSDGEDRSKVSIPKILFGCSHESKGRFHESWDGIAGLGGGPLSLVSQLASSINNKFSYCLVPYAATNSSSLLSFGDRAEVNGPGAVTTPLVAGGDATLYTLSLEGISVGNEKVGSGQGDIIIDSGTTFTFLDNSMMAPLVDKVAQSVKYPRVKDSDFDLCFNVSGASGGSLEFPELTFEFSGAPVTLPPMNAFVEVDAGLMCLAAISTGEDGGIRIFGNIAQQNLHIGYDLGARKLTFAPADCANL